MRYILSNFFFIFVRSWDFLWHVSVAMCHPQTFILVAVFLLMLPHWRVLTNCQLDKIYKTWQGTEWPSKKCYWRDILSATVPVYRNLEINHLTVLCEIGSLSGCRLLKSTAMTRKLRSPDIKMTQFSPPWSKPSSVTCNKMCCNFWTVTATRICLQEWTWQEIPMLFDVSHDPLSI